MAILLLLMPQQVRIPGPGGSSHAANISFVQTCNTAVTSASTTTALNIGSTGNCGAGLNPTAGDLVYVVSAHNNVGNLPSATDTLGNSWTCSGSGTQFNTCFSKIATGGADIVTITTSNVTTGLRFSYEFTNAVGAIDVAGTQNTQSSSSSWTLPSVTTVNAVDAAIGCGYSNGIGTITFTQGSGFVIPSKGQSSVSNAGSAFCEYQIVSPAGTYTPTVTVSSSQAGFGFTVAVK